jgi:hypothetical protein
MAVENIMNAKNWDVNTRYMIPVPGTIYQLSVLPEHTYYYRDEKGLIQRSKSPVGVELNCAVMEPSVTPEGILWSPVYFTVLNDEDEYLDFMISMKQTHGDVVHGEW